MNSGAGRGLCERSPGGDVASIYFLTPSSSRHLCVPSVYRVYPVIPLDPFRAQAAQAAARSRLTGCRLQDICCKRRRSAPTLERWAHRVLSFLGPCPARPPPLNSQLCRVFPPPQATCERGFAAMEESHQKVIDELQRKHQRELENLHEEKERLLAEETAATIAGT